MDLQLVEQFLFDVRAHFRASLETSEYENASNLFHVTEAESTLKLLQRCEQLLVQCNNKKALYQNDTKSNGVNGTGIDSSLERIAIHSIATTTTAAPIKVTNGTKPIKATLESEADASYLDMTACCKKKTIPNEFNDLNSSIYSDKTFRCSTKANPKLISNDMSEDEGTEEDEDEHATTDDDCDEVGQVYDICQVSQIDKDEFQKAIVGDMESTSSVDCPYVDLPAGHLSIQKSSKYGQLQRIEKRLFFDQSKKCYCGILNDWLLCYADGPTACKPALTLYLKSPGIEIEHSGEGKRRELCFQITTAVDPSKKFVFQAVNEVDAKEWIHAIEAAIRGDTPVAAINNSATKQSRKLPSPPVQKKLTFLGSAENNGHCGVSLHSNTSDYIYEEPSPLYQVHEPNGPLLMDNRTNAPSVPPDLIDKNSCDNPQALAKRFEYDIPKCPPQPLKPMASAAPESETAGLLNTTPTEQSATDSLCGSSSPAKSNSSSSEKLDFQSKVKDVHSKLSSQLSVVGSLGPERLKKAVRKTYSGSSNETETLALTIPAPVGLPTPTNKELKKQKKSNTPQSSPQKPNNNNNNTNNNNNFNSEKSAKNWFLNRLNKSTSSVRNSTPSSPAKCKQSEKENLLNNLETCDTYDGPDNNSSNPTSPILKVTPSNGAGAGAGTAGGSSNGSKSKVNMIINQFEASGHMAMFSVETLAANAMASFNSFCDNDCNNYEPIMAVSTPPNSFMKKV